MTLYSTPSGDAQLRIPRGRSEFTRFELHDLRRSVDHLHTSDPRQRSAARRGLRRLNFRMEDWVARASLFDRYQLERRISDGSIKVVTRVSRATPTERVPPGRR